MRCSYRENWRSFLERAARASTLTPRSLSIHQIVSTFFQSIIKLRNTEKNTILKKYDIPFG